MPSPRGSATSPRTATLAGPRRLALAAATGGLMALACVGTVAVVLSGTSTGPALRPPPLPGQGPLAPGPEVVVPGSPPRPRPVGALPGSGTPAVPAVLRLPRVDATASAAVPPVQLRPAPRPPSRAFGARPARAALTRADGPSSSAGTSSTGRPQRREDGGQGRREGASGRDERPCGHGRGRPVAAAERGSGKDRDEDSPRANGAAQRCSSRP